ncbi:hypothetical protein ACI79D_16985 [Geodermatophilus sp. SYSU D00708]
MAVAGERSPLADRRAAAMRTSVEAIRQAAATAQLVALTFEEIACAADAAALVHASERLHDRALRARRRAAEERDEALRMWTRAAGCESAPN